MSKIAFDFNSIKKRIIENLKVTNNWANFLSYGVIDSLIDPIAQELAYEMQYQEYLTFENWWNKAKNKSSLLVQSSVHGYNVPRKKGAIGTLRISTSKTFDEPYEKDLNIEIPKFFQFSGNNIYVVSAHDYTLSPYDNYIDIECKQGESKTVSFTPEGINYEEKLIEDGDVDNDFFELYVNGQLWKKVDTLFECDGDSQSYEIKTKSNLSGIMLKFGNDIFGKKLQSTDKVVFKYVSTKGKEGNIYSNDIIKLVESQAFDNEGNAVKLYVTNISAIVGGADYPSIDEIRTLSPRVYQTGDRASSLDDYTYKLKEINNISKVNVWGAYEVLKDKKLDPWEFIPSEENVVHIALLNDIFENLTDVEKNNVVDKLHIKNDPTDIIHFETVEKIPLIINIDATVQNSSYILTQVKANIENTLKNSYGIENIQFNTNIYFSDFIRLIDEVEGVRNHISSILLKSNNLKFSQAYLLGFRLPIYPIDYKKFIFYIKDNSEENAEFKKLAYCDANGNIIGYDKYNTNGSSINLSTGKGTLVVKSGLYNPISDYELKIEYASANEDLLLNERYQIFSYAESNIKLSYPKI